MNYRFIIFEYLEVKRHISYKWLLEFKLLFKKSNRKETTSEHQISITGKISRGSYINWIIIIIISIATTLFVGPFTQGEDFSLHFDESSYYSGETYKYFNSIMDYKSMIAIVVLTAIILVMIKRFIMHKTFEPKGKSINIYSRELPSNLRPAHMRLLLNDGLIDEMSLGSTIIDLIDRGYLEYYKDRKTDNIIDFFSHENNKIVKTSKSDEKLLKYEKLLIDWFINNYGNGVEVSAKQVNEGLRNKKIFNNMEACDVFMEWQAQVLLSFPILKYYRQNRQHHTYIPMSYEIITAIAIFAVVGFYSLIGFVFSLLGLFFSIYYFGSLILTYSYYALNQQGVDEICEWLSLRKFLIDFGDMKYKNAEMVEIWDYYLTYSIALEISEKASKEINCFFGDNIFMGKYEALPKKRKKEIKINKLILDMQEEYKKL